VGTRGKSTRWGRVGVESKGVKKGIGWEGKFEANDDNAERLYSLNTG